jgi:hypothetical protein
MRRRLDIPNGVWESHDYIFLDETEEYSHNLFYYYNSLYTSDGFFPQSFKTQMYLEEEGMHKRARSLVSMKHFLEYVNSRKELTEYPLTFYPPSYIDDINSLDIDKDFDALGITLTQGSAEDSSSYEYEIEYPYFHPFIEHLNFTDKDTLEVVPPHFYEPNPIMYSTDTLSYLDIYPLNIPKAAIKRNWHVAPGSLLFRDDTKKYLNLIRLPINIINTTSKLSLITPDFFRFGYFIRYIGQLCTLGMPI